jgi:hypothetical protein
MAVEVSLRACNSHELRPRYRSLGVVCLATALHPLAYPVPSALQPEISCRNAFGLAAGRPSPRCRSGLRIRDRTCARTLASASLPVRTLGVVDIRVIHGMIVHSRYLLVPPPTIELRRLEGVGRQENQAAPLLARVRLDRS